MISWRSIALFLLMIILAGTAACNPFSSKAGTSPQLARVVRGDLTTTVSGDGNIELSREARLTFGSGGKVARIHVKEGDKVSEGEVLASLDTGSLELARTQAQVALTQAQVAVTQAQVALTQAQVTRQSAEYTLTNTLDKKDTLDLALLKAQIDLKTANYNLKYTQDLYTWSDIKIAKDDVDQSERDLQDLLDKVGQFLPKNADGSYPTLEEYIFGDAYPKPPGYEKWQEEIVHAQARLNTAKDTLNAMLSGSDTEQVAIKKMQIEAADMAVAQARKNLDKLAEEQAISEHQLDSARQSVDQAQQSLALAQQSAKLSQQSLNQAQKQLDEATITAPFAGVVATVGAKEGDTIPSPTVAAQTIIHLIDQSTIELIVELDEIDIPEVKLGQEALISVDALPHDQFKGKVTSIYPIPNEVGGVVLYTVKISIDVPEGSNLKVGMSASADIIIDKKSNVLLVPDRAIVEDSQGRATVEVMVGGQTEQRPVTTGISDGLSTEIISGLSEGEMVVVETKASTGSQSIGFF